MAKIITVPDPILRKISAPIEKLNKKVNSIIDDVESTLHKGNNPRGVGLSAVQIGKPIRVFSTLLPTSGNPDDDQESVISTYVNPEITNASKKLTLGPSKRRPYLEGCLSIPKIWGPIWRHAWIKFKWQDKQLNWKEKKFLDFEARVLQHELDHLNGILFTDHSIKHNLPLYEERNNKLHEIELG